MRKINSIKLYVSDCIKYVILYSIVENLILFIITNSLFNRCEHYYFNRVILNNFNFNDL